MTSVGIAGYLTDTNILLYSRDASEPMKRRRATEVLQRLEDSRLGSFSIQVLGEFFWNATRKLQPPLSPATAQRCIADCVRSWIVFSVEPITVIEALRGVVRYQIPYWDALLWATAKLNAVPTVLSEDFSDGATIEGVRFLNPFSPLFDLSTL